MKKLLLICSFLPFLSHSQYDSTIHLRNEIGTNIAHGLAYIITGKQARESNFGLIYKYHFSEKLRLRVLPSIGIFEQRGTSFFGEGNISYLISEIPNESQVYSVYSHHFHNRYQLKTGFEYVIRPKKTFSFLTGIDLFYSYRRISDYKSYEYYLYDTYSSKYVYNERVLDERDINHIQNIGLSPFIGFEHNISKRWVLLAYFNFNFTYRFGNTENFKNPNVTGFELVKISESNFGLYDSWGTGFISDISVSYRF